MALTFTISPFDAATCTVYVVFTDGGREFGRHVNACVDSAGAYDEAATAERIAQVADGVAVKLSLGVIQDPPPALATSAESEASIADDHSTS